MHTVYHPASWAQSWPKDAKPYASKSVAVSHGHSEDSLIETAFSGPASDIISVPPAPAVQDVQQPEEGSPSSDNSSAQGVTQPQASVTPKEPSSSKSKQPSKKDQKK